MTTTFPIPGSHDHRGLRPSGASASSSRQPPPTCRRCCARRSSSPRSRSRARSRTPARGPGAFGAAAFAGLLALLFLSVALAYGFSRIYGDHVGFGFLTVGALYLFVAAVAGLVGKKSISKVKAPERTITTVKDDVAFAKNPTSVPTRRTSA